MVHEIYCKLPTDRGYERRVETTDETQAIVQQVRMVLGTKPGQVLGSPTFGVDLQKFLFSYNRNPDEIRNLVNAAIAAHIRFDRSRHEVGCEVSFGHNAGDPYEYAVIDIVVDSTKRLGVLVSQE